MRGRRAFTLAELMVAMGLMALCLAMLLCLFAPAMRLWNLAETRGQAEQAMLVAAMGLSRALSQTSSRSLTAIHDHDLSAVSMLSASEQGGQGYDPATGVPIWRSMLVFFVDSRGVLRRTTVKSAQLPTTHAFKLTGAQLRQACQDGGRVVARGLSSFDLSQPGDGTVHMQLVARIDTQQGPEQLSQQTTVRPRDGGGS